MSGHCADPPELSIGVAGEPTSLFEFPQQACDGIDLPDEPARAFRGASGTIHLFATHYVNRQLVGSSFSTLRHVCEPSFVGKHNLRPEAYDEYGWLSGFFTPDGKLIYAIIHNEFHGSEQPALCKSRVFLRCWENSITAAISHDGGFTFARVPGDQGVVARLPRRYTGDQPHQSGYFNPTNIIQFKGDYYLFVSLIDAMTGRSGICALRTVDVTDPTSWRGWDGSGFTIRFVNPYSEPTNDPNRHICRVIGEGRLMFSLGSVTFFEPAKLFIMVMRRQRWEKGGDGTVPGVYFSTSPDLINWSLPSRIISDAEAAKNPDVVQFYPSLLDPDGGDRNFQNVSMRPSLLSIQFETQHENQHRSLVVRRLEIQQR